MYCVRVVVHVDDAKGAGDEDLYQMGSAGGGVGPTRGKTPYGKPSDGTAKGK